jgi:signal transduction histidine kinase
LARMSLEEWFRLACQYIIKSDVVVNTDAFSNTNTEISNIKVKNTIEDNQVEEKSVPQENITEKEKDIEISFDAIKQPYSINGDPILLTELLTNLLDNAIAYGHNQGGIVVRLTHHPVICLCIEDDGPGIPKAEREKILERFYRIPGSSGNGCGLGLAIVKEIADLHQAKLVLLSSNIGGTCIKVQFNWRQ